MSEFVWITSPNDQYDAYVGSHPYGHLLQSFAWGELKRAYGWEPVRLTLAHGNKIVASISILFHNLLSKQTFGYAPRGPVLHFNNPHILTLLQEKIDQIAMEKQAIFIKIDPTLSQLASRAHSHLVRLNYHPVTKETAKEPLQLSRVYRITLPYQNLSHSRLVNQKAALAQLTVEASNSRENLKVFYALLLEYGEQTATKVRTFDYYLRLWSLFNENGCRLFLVRQKNYLIGASLVMMFGDTCYSLYSVYRQSHSALYPESFLHLSIMEWAAACGYRTYEIIDTFSTTKKTSSDTRLFSFPVEPYVYLGEYDRVYAPAKYQLWKFVLPVYYWARS